MPPGHRIVTDVDYVADAAGAPTADAEFGLGRLIGAICEHAAELVSPLDTEPAPPLKVQWDDTRGPVYLRLIWPPFADPDGPRTVGEMVRRGRTVVALSRRHGFDGRDRRLVAELLAGVVDVDRCGAVFEVVDPWSQLFDALRLRPSGDAALRALQCLGCDRDEAVRLLRIRDAAATAPEQVRADLTPFRDLTSEAELELVDALGPTWHGDPAGLADTVRLLTGHQLGHDRRPGAP